MLGRLAANYQTATVEVVQHEPLEGRWLWLLVAGGLRAGTEGATHLNRGGYD